MDRSKLAKKSRNQGHKLERDMVKAIAEYCNLIPFAKQEGGSYNFDTWEVATARMVSRSQDAKKNDVVIKVDKDYLPLPIQCHKHLCRTVKTTIPLDKLPEDGVLITRITRKKKVKEVIQNDYVTMKDHTFFMLLDYHYQDALLTNITGDHWIKDGVITISKDLFLLLLNSFIKNQI